MDLSGLCETFRYFNELSFPKKLGSSSNLFADKCSVLSFLRPAMDFGSFLIKLNDTSISRNSLHIAISSGNSISLFLEIINIFKLFSLPIPYGMYLR